MGLPKTRVKTMPKTDPASDPVKKPLKLDRLRERREALAHQIAALEAKQKKKARTEDTRLKIVIGAAIMSNCELHPETRAGIVEVLKKAVKAPRDREFLKSKGWL